MALAIFTMEQIDAAHAKVKSGVDFPSYIQEMKLLGVVLYEHFVINGYIKYYGANEFTILTNAKWVPIEIAEIVSIEKLQFSLFVHQQGLTDYVSFCKHAGEAGVEKWVVDMLKMSCTYYDKAGNIILEEIIPE